VVLRTGLDDEKAKYTPIGFQILTLDRLAPWPVSMLTVI
jgi:hypothetical protein